MIEKLKQIERKWYILAFVVFLVIFIAVSVNADTDIDYVEIDSSSITLEDYNPSSYSIVSKDWSDVTNQDDITIIASDMSDVFLDGDDYSYDGNIIHLNEGDVLEFNVSIPVAGAYQIKIDQLDVSSSILPNEISLSINSELQYEESRVIELPTLWEFETNDFLEDRYGNEILPSSVKVDKWNSTYLYDSTGLNTLPLKFNFNSGSNTIRIECLGGEILLGNIYITSIEEPISYETYKNLHSGNVVADMITIGAENFRYKTNPSITLSSERDPSASSYNTQYLRLNSIDGYSFRSGNDQITYQVEVEETGFYYLGLKYRQDYLMQMPVFREVRIDGEIPFSEVSAYPFAYTPEYQNIILNNNQENYKFYLEEGTHEISFRVVIEPYRNAYENILGIMNQINELSLEIKKLTGNTSDRYRDWDLIDYIPDIEVRMDNWIEVLYEIVDGLQAYSNQENPGQLTNINLAIERLEELREDVDDIPTKMVMLSDGSSSASQFLGATIQALLENGLDIEKIFVTGDEDLPAPKAGFFTRNWESIKRFFLSFTADDYAVKQVEEGTIEVWVNHPRQYIEIMQTMIDTTFTVETGIEVQLSVMPDENKLILANSTDYSPDVALGVNHWIPYEFAIRGASLDLRQFTDGRYGGFEETVGLFSPGVMIPYAFEEGIFGLPETQNFWVTFYRTDIFEALSLPVPDTWEEVIQILPELQRFGMNYYEPLAFFKGFKPFVATIPFIYQFGGTLYADDGMTTVINSEETLDGINLMTELFTIYNLPKEIPNFYNHFRYGTLPIGISDLATYIQLTIAAPEIAGKWDIALHPGVDNGEGEIVRWAASGAQASMILSNTKLEQESWEFLSWWMSTEIQSDFAQRLQTTYGVAYLWNTANLEAFESLPIPTNHKNVILEQWDYAMEASRIPGSYMVEREISNAWNKIVFDDANPRVTLDEAVKTANREILYKMEEFDYVRDGVIQKPYNVPTIYNIEYWLKERD